MHAVQRKDLEEAGQGKTPAEHLDLLRSEVVKRRINQLSVKSYALGVALIDGKTEAAAARTEGEALLKQADALAPDLKAIHDLGAQKRLQRDLNEARMEALYAVEQKAMSLRLNRYQEAHRK